jgi:Zn-dependent peptidase ImmA (M78 family)
MYERGFKSWCEKVALQQRRELELAPTDPLDARALAKHLEVLVWLAGEVPGLEGEALRILTRDDADSWSAVTICTGAKDLIILNPTHSAARQASDITHELSHIIIGHEPARVDVTEDGLLILNTYNKTQEDEAKWLSSCLLLPRPALLLIRARRIDLGVAANLYGVSLQMLTYRMNVLGLSKTLRRRSASGVNRTPRS